MKQNSRRNDVRVVEQQLEVDELCRLLRIYSRKSTGDGLSNGEYISADLVKKHIERVSKTVLDFGLYPEQLDLLALASSLPGIPDELRYSSFRLCLPATTISTATIISVFGHFTSHMSTGSRVVVLKWILVTFDYIESVNELRKLYGVLFRLVDDHVLSQYVCHALCLLTRKEDVKQFRIQKLFRIKTQLKKEDQGINSLLRVYREFRKDSVIHAFSPQSSREISSLFQIDVEWRNALLRVKGSAEGASSSQRIASTAREFDSGQAIPATPAKGQLFKRGREYVSSWLERGIPRGTEQEMGVGTLQAVNIDLGSGLSVRGRDISIENISSFEEFCNNIARLDLPEQLSTAVASTYMMHLVSLDPSVESITRISNWMAFKLYEEFYWRDGDVATNTRRSSLFAGMLSLTMFLQELLPTFESFLFEYIAIWNGVDHFRHVVLLLSYISPCRYEFLRDAVLNPLTNLFLHAETHVSTALLRSLSNLVVRWSDIRWKNDDTRHFIAARDGMDDLELSRVIISLVDHVNRLTFVSMHKDGKNTFLSSAVCDFYSTIARIPLESDFMFTYFPSRRVFDTLLLSDSAFIISSAMHLLYLLKSAIDYLGERESHEMDGISTGNALNPVILEYSHALWLEDIFKESFMEIPATTSQRFQSSTASSCLSIFSSLAFASIFRSFLLGRSGSSNEFSRDLKEDAQIREDYLKALDEKGFTGVSEFVNTFIP